MDPRDRIAILIALLAVLTSLACPPGPTKSDGATLEAILDASDRRDHDPQTWSGWLDDDDPGTRRMAARAIGQVRAPDLASLLAERLKREELDAVRDELLFAAGQIAAGETRGVLEELAGGTRTAERALAIEALGKLGGGDSEHLLRAALDDSAGLVRREALLALVRVRGRRVEDPPPLDDGAARALVARLSALAADDEPDVRQAACYALAETPLAGRVDALVALLSDAEPFARLLAARALGRIAGGDRTAARALVAAGDEPDVHVAAALAAALAPLAARGAGPALVRSASRTDSPAAFHVRAAAITALARRIEEETDEAGKRARQLETIESGLHDPSPTVRRAALVAAARARSALDSWPDATDSAARTASENVGLLDAVSHFATGPDPWTRAAAMTAAAHLPDRAQVLVLRSGLGDEDPTVTTAALETIGALDAAGPFDPRALALQVLSPTGPVAEDLPAVAARSDLAVRATALGLLGEHGTLQDVDVIEAVLREARGLDSVELRLAALDALETVAGERAKRVFAAFISDPSAAVSAAAARLAAKHGATPGPAPRTDPRRSTATLTIGTDVLSEADNPSATLETDAGVIELELFREQAPRHVKSFVTLAREGFYDGLSVHRVVTGFVVQGLDPRGDGWGSGEAFLRDEINRARYGRGSLGMPNAGPDTAGCQIFITHVPTPHLDGRYTVFGRVTRGMDIIDRIEVGQLIRRVTID